MKKKLEIELRSDLCAGTGKHYAAVIDLDTALDEYGIPFIPAKRIKGCMREIAEQFLCLDADTIRGIFGERGAGDPGSLRLTDARISHYDNQLEEIKTAISNGEICANDNTELFCSVRAETAIENDTAKKGTLRFTRVVNRLSPIDGQPLKFYADLETEEQYGETVETICRGLKNIGYKKNRGLGSIKCALVPSDDSFKLAPYPFEDDGQYRMSYLVFLEEDMMLPAADANHSLDYIPGTSVQGALAVRYRKKYGDDGFEDIFLSGSVRFGNLYVSDSGSGNYYPAPRFLAKIKAAKGPEEEGIHNMIANRDDDRKKEMKPQYKPLKNGYIRETDEYKETDRYKETKTEIIYHNALNTEESRENNGGLYTQYCISSGQYFKGVITADGRSMKKLYPLFEDGVLCFGRSKTAQYSRCVIKRPEDVDVQPVSKTTVPLKANDTAAFLCESDVLLVKDGRYTVDLEDFCAALNKCVGTQLPEEDMLDPFTGIATRIISGYNAKWNHKKPQFPVIKAGSTVVFQVKEDGAVPDRFTLGEKQNEGYGQIRLIPDAKQFCSGDADKKKDTIAEEEKGTDKKQQDFLLANARSELLRAVGAQRELDEILGKAIVDADRLAKKLNASQVGRLTLMCRESSCLTDLEKRINSIKTESFREQAANCILKEIARSGWTEETDWAKAKQYALSLLTVAKYRLRKKEGE